MVVLGARDDESLYISELRETRWRRQWKKGSNGSTFMQMSTGYKVISYKVVDTYSCFAIIG